MIIEPVEPESQPVIWDKAYLPVIIHSLTIDPPVALRPTSEPITGHYNEQLKVILSFANPLVLQGDPTSQFGAAEMEGL